MNDLELVVVWSGGELLPAYDGGCTLTEAVRDVRPPVKPYAPVTRHGRRGGKLRKYSEAEREAIKALRQDGFRLHEIAERFNMPLRTVHNILSVPAHQPSHSKQQGPGPK